MLDDRWMWIHKKATGSTTCADQDPLPSKVFAGTFLISHEELESVLYMFLLRLTWRKRALRAV